MAQTYQMKHNPQGTIYSLLTVESDGQMTMTFHGTDREICHEANVTDDGRITTGGSLFPGLESGKWQLMADVQGTVPAVDSEAESERTTEGLSPMCAEPAVPTLRGQSPCNPPSATHTGDSPREPRPRRQRKPRKPRVEHETITNNHEPLTVNHDGRNLLSAVGMVAAATVALFVIYETGLLIPLGVIGLATGGLLK